MKTIMSALTAEEVRSVVRKANAILGDDPDHYSDSLLEACRKISENYDKIIDDALTGEDGA